jgi:hypothetical protein
MPAITSTNLANAIVKLVAADALPALMGNLVMGNLVNRDFEPSLAKAGDTVNVPVPPTLTANNLAQGGTVVTQNPNLGNAQIVLNTHAEATFQIPDAAKAMAVPDVLRSYMEPAVVALAEKVETDLLALATSFTANTALGAAGTAVTEDLIDQAETALFNAKVPASMQKNLVVDAATYSALRMNPRFSEYSRAGEAGLKTLIEGNIGRLKDFFVFRSQFIRKSGTPTTTRNLAFAKDAIGLAIRRLPQPLPGTGAIAEYAELGNFGVRVVMSYQPDTLAQQFTVDILYGAAILRNNYGVLINS